MSIVNTAAVFGTQNTLASASTSRTKSLERLATALRINRASDDAAGLSVSEGLRGSIRANQMAQRNANDGYAMLQIADGGASQVGDSLQRMRELALQSQNGTYNATDRQAMQKEYDQLREEITRTAESTTYNGKKLLTGVGGPFQFQVSDQSGETGTVSASNTTNLAAGLGLGSIDSPENASLAMKSIDDAMQTVTSLRAGYGATTNRLETTIANLAQSTVNQVEAESRIRDTDYAAESTRNIRDQILERPSLAMTAQANSMSEGLLGLLKG